MPPSLTLYLSSPADRAAAARFRNDFAETQCSTPVFSVPKSPGAVNNLILRTIECLGCLGNQFLAQLTASLDHRAAADIGRAAAPEANVDIEGGRLGVAHHDPHLLQWHPHLLGDGLA